MWNISMLKIQHVFEIKNLFCVIKARNIKIKNTKLTENRFKRILCNVSGYHWLRTGSPVSLFKIIFSNALYKRTWRVVSRRAFNLPSAQLKKKCEVRTGSM